jgi:hypothetical protein
MEVQAAHVRQSDVENEAGSFVRIHVGEAIMRCREGIHLKPYRQEQTLHGLANHGVVVDDYDDIRLTPARLHSIY